MWIYLFLKILITKMVESDFWGIKRKNSKSKKVKYFTFFTYDPPPPSSSVAQRKICQPVKQVCRCFWVEGGLSINLSGSWVVVLSYCQPTNTLYLFSDFCCQNVPKPAARRGTETFSSCQTHIPQYQFISKDLFFPDFN